MRVKPTCINMKASVSLDKWHIKILNVPALLITLELSSNFLNKIYICTMGEMETEMIYKQQ